MNDFLEISYQIGCMGVVFLLVLAVWCGLKCLIGKMKMYTTLEDIGFMAICAIILGLNVYFIFCMVYFIYKII